MFGITAIYGRDLIQFLQKDIYDLVSTLQYRGPDGWDYFFSQNRALGQTRLQEGIVFHTTCDTEVFLKAYEFYYKESFEKLNGQFGALIWNKRKKQLTIARDRFGIRPLYILKFSLLLVDSEILHKTSSSSHIAFRPCSGSDEGKVYGLI